MKQYCKKISFLVILVCMTAFFQTAYAASEAECAIWLCLPGGFPSGCSSAKSAMQDRIKKFKPPLPAFTSCVSNYKGSHISYQYNHAALIATVPSTYQKNRICRKYTLGYSDPPNCVATLRYVDVLIDGKIAGNTYYWAP